MYIITEEWAVNRNKYTQADNLIKNLSITLCFLNQRATNSKIPVFCNLNSFAPLAYLNQFLIPWQKVMRNVSLIF